jgi:hypothetical protein
MNLNQILTILVCAASSFSTVWASEASDTQAPASSLTRAEVRAEYLRSRGADALSIAAVEQHPFGTLTASNLSRDAVRTALAQARANGELFASVDADQRPFATSMVSRARADVRSEAYAAAREPFNPNTVGG